MFIGIHTSVNISMNTCYVQNGNKRGRVKTIFPGFKLKSKYIDTKYASFSGRLIGEASPDICLFITASPWLGGLMTKMKYFASK